MASIKLNPGGRQRVLQGHPWVYVNEVQKLPDTEYDGKTLECRDSQGRLIGTGIYNSRSQILWRKISSDKADLNASFLALRLKTSLARRKDLQAGRLVWSESDGLPGLTVDRYENVLVVQISTLAMEYHLENILDWLEKNLAPSSIILRNDAPLREKEGLERYVRIGRGSAPEPFWLNLGGVEFLFDWKSGQKTGFYLDQCEQHRRVAAYAKGRRVLDVFCNQGGFALHCAKEGALSVTAVDASSEAIALGRQNALRNNYDVKWICENAFDFLKRQKSDSWDLVILDPPPFAKSRDKLDEALRGYKEINLRAMKQLAPEGILATYACSHHIRYDLFRDMLVAAAGDAGRSVRLREITRQSYDHPVILTIPESEYLRGYILEME
jgi:23S rRNA (cytosine1962-C5)-methyltransferase